MSFRAVSPQYLEIHVTGQKSFPYLVVSWKQLTVRLLNSHVFSSNRCQSPQAHSGIRLMGSSLHSFTWCTLRLDKLQAGSAPFLSNHRSNQSYEEKGGGVKNIFKKKAVDSHEAWPKPPNKVDHYWILCMQMILLLTITKEVGVWIGHAGCDLSHHATSWKTTEVAGHKHLFLYLVWVFLSYFVVLCCTMSILGFVPCLISVTDSCVNVKSLSIFLCGSWKWGDHYRAD